MGSKRLWMLTGVALAVLAAQAAAYMPAAAVATSIRGVSTIEKIDAKTREVTLKREDGSLVTIVAGEEVRNFAQMKVGDNVRAVYIESISIQVKAPDK